MFYVLLNSFMLVAASEMGDKTQLLAFSLAARYPKEPWPIMAGILTATLLNHGLASYLGEWISFHIPANILSAILGVLFVGFGIWTLKPDEFDDDKKESRFGAYITTTFLFFLAEMGDKTQLATVALGARYQSAVFVTAGTTLGMLVSDGLAVFLGERLAGTKQMKWIRWVAAGLFFIFGIMAFGAAIGQTLHH